MFLKKKRKKEVWPGGSVDWSIVPSDKDLKG